MKKKLAQCFACGSDDLESIFESRGIGFTLAQRPNDLTTTSAMLCRSCSHVQTPPLEDIESYYDTGYNFQLSNADEDDIYTADLSGAKVYRSEHQASCVEKKQELRPGLRVLDYGCGKARTLELLKRANPEINPFTFDVSDIYTELWSRFVPPSNQSVYTVRDDWAGTMDLVLSFFALEHTADPQGFVRDLARLVRPGGGVHVVIPNMYRNISDLVVIDHVQHFSAASLERLFADAGYSNIRIDEETHRAAFIVNASFDPAIPRALPQSDPDRLVSNMNGARSIARQWADIAERIGAFEAAHPTAKSVIYGSGVYGMFIASTLGDLSRVAAFLDMNPFRQGRRLLGIPILAPDSVPTDVQAVYVGLNPQDSKAIIAGVTPLHERPRDFFFL